MTEQPRQKELEDKVFKDENGVPYDDWRVLSVPNPDDKYSSIDTYVCFLNGKLHGYPGIEYPDGLEEEWNNGKFIKIIEPPRIADQKLTNFLCNPMNLQILKSFLGKESE